MRIKSYYQNRNEYLYHCMYLFEMIQTFQKKKMKQINFYGKILSIH